MPCPTGAPSRTIVNAFDAIGCHCNAHIAMPYLEYEALTDLVRCKRCLVAIKFDANGAVLQTYLPSAHGGKPIPVVAASFTGGLNIGGKDDPSAKRATWPALDYKAHFLIGLRSSADMGTVIARWAHTPSQADIDAAIAMNRDQPFTQFAVVNPTGIVAAQPKKE